MFFEKHENIIRIKESLVRVNSLENHADDIFDNAVARLFEDEKMQLRSLRSKKFFLRSKQQQTNAKTLST